MHARLTSAALAIGSIAALLGSCSSRSESAEPTPTTAQVDYLRVEERIVELVPGDDGVTYVHFERSALRYRIDPAEADDAGELLAYARRALDEDREVCALVDRSTVPPRKDPALFHLPPPLIVGFK